jgi:hypothetical protein
MRRESCLAVALVLLRGAAGVWACVRAALHSWLRLAALLQGWVEEGEEEEHYGAGGGDGEEVDDEEDEQFVQQAGKSTAGLLTL